MFVFGVCKYFVGECGVDRNVVSFCGYWKIGVFFFVLKVVCEVVVEFLV